MKFILSSKPLLCLHNSSSLPPQHTFILLFRNQNLFRSWFRICSVISTYFVGTVRIFWCLMAYSNGHRDSVHS
ncbi:Os02g0459400, partial [Oryza sativa Japonica Group]